MSKKRKSPVVLDFITPDVILYHLGHVYFVADRNDLVVFDLCRPESSRSVADFMDTYAGADFKPVSIERMQLNLPELKAILEVSAHAFMNPADPAPVR